MSDDPMLSDESDVRDAYQKKIVQLMKETVRQDRESRNTFRRETPPVLIGAAGTGPNEISQALSPE